jgi:spore germination protein YaaH
MKTKMIKNIIIIAIALIAIVLIFTFAKNFTKDENEGKIALIINNKDVTARLKKDIFIDEQGIIYLSKEDIANFFDEYIYLEEETNQIITTYGTKVAALSLEQNKMTINGSTTNILKTVIEKDETYYMPFSEMNDIYNVEIKYIEKTNTITVDSLDKEQIKYTASKNISIKSKTTAISKTLDKVKKGEKVIYISSTEKGWAKVRTENGIIGYVKENKLTNKITVREDMEENKENQKISLVWDYYSEYATAPNRTGTTIEGINVVSPSFFSLKQGENGALLDNVGTAGQDYINWEKENNYQVWAMVSNNSLKDTTSTILNNYEYREILIENIVNLSVKYQLDGINIDFEYMYETDKDKFSRFIIELQPRLKEIGVTLSVDVTAPDGSADWSLCYNRNVIGNVADYIIFMAYDQYGTSSVKAGTTAGYDWVKTNLNKFVGVQEGIPSEKVILGIPFYTRLWKEDSAGNLSSSTVNMKAVDIVLPSKVTRNWDDDTKQYYVEYQQEGYTYKMWIEDEESIRAKLSLVEEFELGGVAFWEKDRETESIWSTISEALSVENN